MRTREEIDKRFGPITEERRQAISRAKTGVSLSPTDRQRVTKQLRALNASRRGTHRSLEIRTRIAASKKGIATAVGAVNGNWMGDKVQYPGIHQWLKDNFGSANQCQNKNCLGKSQNYDWARLRDVEYKRRREYFIQLCRSCHRFYDRNESFALDIRDLLAPTDTPVKD